MKRKKKGYQTYLLMTPKGTFGVKVIARKLKTRKVEWQKPTIGFRPMCFGCGGEQV